MKVIQSISVDHDVILACRNAKINISKVCNEALKVYSSQEDQTNLEQKKENLKTEISILETKINKNKEKESKLNIKEEKLNDFLINTNKDVIRNEVSLNYWSKETGLSKEELIKKKKG